MRNFPRVKVHDLAMTGGNPKRECKCLDCENLRARVKRVFRPWYVKITKR